jgi:predicted Fe-Mo cluster-binding NifX family protein
MKVAITSTGTTMDSLVDPRFGRSPYIAFVDLEKGQLEALANPFENASDGAGVEAAQWVLDKGAAAFVDG